MPKGSESFAPYTSIGNMLLILKRIRKGWVPSQVDRDEMIRVGITESTANRTIAALEFLGLIDNSGYLRDTWKAIATSTANDYPKVLEGILRHAYPEIFTVYPNPADASDLDLYNAFAKSEPLNQRERMASLFRGLCQEAGLIAGEPLTRERSTTPKQSNQKQPSKTKEEKQTSDRKQVPDDEQPRYSTSISVSPSLKWYNDLETLMGRLPNPDKPTWTKAERERWLTALQSMLDLLIETKEG